jgi:hypothetical protein
MPSKNSQIAVAAKAFPPNGSAQFVRVHFKTLDLPPIKDGLVLARGAQVTAETLLQMLKLVSTDQFVRIPIEDDLISDILIREPVLRKLTAGEIQGFVLDRIKPSMADGEVIAVQMSIEVLIEETF